MAPPRELTVAKLAVELAIAAACLVWAFYWFVVPDPKSGTKYVDAWLGEHTHSRFFRTDGRQGVTLLMQTLPWVVVVLLSFAVIELRARIRRSRGGDVSMEKGWRMGTYPLWVSEWSPFGRVLTAAEALGIMCFVVLMTYHFGRATYNGFARIDASAAAGGGHGQGNMMAPAVSKSWMKVRRAAFYLGTTSVIPFSLLWVPVSRGSPLLRLLRIPFERAVRYHIWLAVLTIGLLTFHSLGYIAYYVAVHQTDRIFEWVTEQEKCAVIAGLVAWIVGLVILFSSLNFFRRRYYDTFFAVHHLYLLFALFWLYHAIWTYHSFVVPLLLFFVDRFIRAVQSSRVVHVLVVKRLDSGALELELPINDPLYGNRSPSSSTQGQLWQQQQYNALSTWCIRIPAISRLQSHFFSGASSPLEEGKHALSVIIKPLGGWTNRLAAAFSSTPPPDPSLHFNANKAAESNFRCPLSTLIEANVEGPYGDESDFYLRYNTLILVAGGIGVTPVLAILRDILHRYKLRQRSPQQQLSTSIEVFHCIRKPEELCLLDSVQPHRILPGYDTMGLNITVHIYVTSSKISAQDVQEAADVGSNDMDSGGNKTVELSKFRWRTQSISSKSSFSQQGQVVSPPPTEAAEAIKEKEKGIIASMSTDERAHWAALTTLSSLVGYFVLSGIANTFIIRSYDRHTFANYNRVHVFVACMAIAVVVFGGGFVVAWLWRRSIMCTDTSSTTVQPKSLSDEDHGSGSDNIDLDDDDCLLEAGCSPWSGDVHLGGRPNWEDVFHGLRERYRGECVGVLVSGSESLQGDVATECRKRSSLGHVTSKSADGKNPVFHYHSVSFSF